MLNFNFIFTICILTTTFAKGNIVFPKNNGDISHPFYFSINDEKFKRHIDLGIFSDANEAKQGNNDTDNIISVCGGEDQNNGIACYCENRELSCWKGLNDANIKPAMEYFIIEDVFLTDINITVLKKDKIFPGNENSIKKLTFYNTKIIQIEIQAFDKFISLNSLTLSNNFLKHIDENVLTMQLGKTLLTLSLSFNNLTFHDLSMFKYLTNLEDLSLHGNKQRNGKIEGKFPESLSNLKTLKMGDCGLFDLDEHVFDNLEQLETLRFHYNNFVSIPSAINVLQKLRILNFDGNQIDAINKGSFVNPSLEKILLTESLKLKYVGDCTFCSLPNLIFVDFWHCNNLSFIHENAFGAISNGYTPMLDEFDIENCSISVLPEELLDWKQIPKLSLNHNPFACNCSMAWLFNDLLSNNSFYEDKLYSLRDTYHHHKYNLGCLGPPPTTANHTHPYTIIEIFESCKTSNSLRVFWHFVIFLFFVCVVAAVFIYARRCQFSTNWYNRMS